MKIEWIGHACFQLTAKDGTVVITDPYDETVGIDMLPLRAHMITMSHGHHDHQCMDMIEGTPMLVRGAQTATVGSIRSTAVCSYHDDARGAKRGGNIIRIFAAEGLKLVHMGDQGCMPDAQALDAIADADVMMIPVGGTYTVDARGARAIIEAAKPRCVIPMHMKTARCGYPLATVGEFMREMGVQNAKAVAELECARGSVPQGVVLMQPQADAL